MRRKYLAAVYIAAFEWLLSWQQWDGVIKTVLALWVFWVLNLMLMELAAGELLDKWRDENAEIQPGDPCTSYRMGSNRN